MFEKIKPLYDKVLVQREQKEERSAAGLYIPTSETDAKHNIGKVIAVGNGKMTDAGFVIAPSVEVGDRVIFNKYGGVELDKDYVMLNEIEIIGVF